MTKALTTKKKPFDLFAVLDEFINAVQAGERERLMVWVRQAVTDYPQIKPYLKMDVERLERYLEFFSPNLYERIRPDMPRIKQRIREAQETL